MSELADAQDARAPGSKADAPSGKWLIGWAIDALKGRTEKTLASVSFLAGLVSAGLVGGGWWLFLSELGDSAANQALQFAGTAERLADRQLDPAHQFTLEQAQSTQLWGLAFAAVWGIVGYVLFRIFWEHCWSSGPACHDSVVRWIPALPMLGAIFSVIERLVTLGAVRRGDSVAGGNGGAELVETVEMFWYTPAIVLTLAWAKWVLGGITIMAVLGMIVSALARASQPKASASRDETRPAGPAIDLTEDQPQSADSTSQVGETDKPTSLPALEGTGISCSGGGIRAASFTLGALSELERRPNRADEGDENKKAPPLLKDSVLGSAKYLASVSGGGYAASAWRMAAGVTSLPEKPMIGGRKELNEPISKYPTTETTPQQRHTDLLSYVRERRNFLASGTGGLPRALVRFVASMAFHLLLIFTAVFVLAWPWGKLLSSWPIGALFEADASDDTLNAVISSHHWLPPLLTLGVAGVVLIGRMFMERTKRRTIVDAVIAGLVFLAVGSALVQLVLPSFVELVIDQLPSGSIRLAVSGVWAVALTAVWQTTKRLVRKNARYLGGVFLAVGLAVFGAFTIDWSLRDITVLGNPWLFGAAMALLLAGFVLLNPDRWSLHDFYRRRLQNTFAIRRIDGAPDERGEPVYYFEPDKRKPWKPIEPPEVANPPIATPGDFMPRLSDYPSSQEASKEARGPTPVICCAAARQIQDDTGIAVVSLTFEPDEVALYRWTNGKLKPARLSHAEFVRRLPNGYKHIASPTAAASISGAAVAPSMGRMNMSTTNALVAAFNARLGVWVPNPARETVGRFVRPRMVNMFKEIFGMYDSIDPLLYATDGGHWDNLGLVELIRRRCARVIAIDTSGDALGTYKTLKQAIDLAKNECNATVEFADDEWAKMAPDEDGRVPQNFMVGTITYRDDTVAPLLYVKAAVAQDSSLAILRYAAGDPTFPNYSTANQMLTDRQMSNLMLLGIEAMEAALDTHSSFATTEPPRGEVAQDGASAGPFMAEVTGQT